MSGTKPYNERELLLRIAQGDEEAFTSLFYQHKEKIFYYSLSITHSPIISEEITQEIFMTIWSERTTLPDIDYFRSWLKTVTRNKALNALKKMANEKTAVNNIRQLTSEADKSAEDNLLWKQYQLLLQQAIAQLSDHQRQVYLLSREEHLEYAEIANRLNISVNTVKYHMKAAFRTIREFLKQYGTELSVIFLIYF